MHAFSIVKLTGPGRLTKLGSGLLHVGSTNTASGGLTISNGTVRFQRTQNLGAVPAEFDADFITLDGGCLQKEDQGEMASIFGTNCGITIASGAKGIAEAHSTGSSTRRATRTRTAARR